MSLRLYCGEYLLHPVPLHFGMNHCTHGCWYCFANLNRANRRMVNDDLPRIARWFEKDKGPLEYWFLKNGYPMLVSNDADPFAASNRESALALVELSRLYGFGLCWQTKGGDRDVVDYAMSGKPTMWDITLTSDDSELLKRMEPNAPSYEERLELVRDLKAAGHHVVISPFPFVPGWWRDYPAALQTWHDLGVRHLWSGHLHFSKWQVAAMSESVRGKYRQWIDLGMKRGDRPDDAAYTVMVGMAESMGFSVYNCRTSAKHDFWDDYYKLGYPFFPTLDVFCRELHQIGEGKPISFRFDTFDNWADVGAPSDLSIYRDYLQPFARSLRNNNENMRCRSFREVHGFHWRCMEYPTLFRTKQFNVLVGSDDAFVVDEDGRSIMVYIPEGMDEWGYVADDIAEAAFY